MPDAAAKVSREPKVGKWAEAPAAVPGDRVISLQRFEQGKIGFAGGRD
jgi:hypothetical protein